MKSHFKLLRHCALVATLVGFGSLGLNVAAQTAPGVGAGANASAPGEHIAHGNPAKAQTRQVRRMNELKAKLKLSAAQESAWTNFTNAMLPSAHAQHEQHLAELAKLPTPERIDKMRSLRAQHMAEMTARMDQRGEASKTFYATLTAEQRKVFDDESVRMMSRMNQRGGHGMHEMHHGRG